MHLRVLVQRWQYVPSIFERAVCHPSTQTSLCRRVVCESPHDKTLHCCVVVSRYDSSSFVACVAAKKLFVLEARIPASRIFTAGVVPNFTEMNISKLDQVRILALYCANFRVRRTQCAFRQTQLFAQFALSSIK